MLFLFCGSVLIGFSEAKAQEFGRVPITEVTKKPIVSKPKPASIKKIAQTKKVRTPPREIKAPKKPVKPQTGYLLVSSQVGAEVQLQKLNARGEVVSTVKKTVRDDPSEKDETVGDIEFDAILPGKYKVFASLDGYDSSESDEIFDILPNKAVAINLTLEPIKYSLTIETNMREGEVRYAPAKLVRTNSNGTRETDETGGYCIAPIKNGVATVVGLQKGYYNIDFRPNQNTIEYQQLKTSIKVPEEVPEADDDNNDSDNARKFEIDLEKKISTEVFSPSWNNTEWNVPNGWRLGNSLKTNKIVGIALPSIEKFRYYTDFEMITDVTSLDDNTVSFVFRAQDSKNYYLLQISGAKAPEPFVAKGFIVRNGQSQQIFSNPIPHFAKTIASGRSFRLIVKGRENNTKEKENLFEVFIEEDGKPKPVGNIIDSDKIYNKGAVGIAAVNNSNFEVAFFQVCNKSCQ